MRLDFEEHIIDIVETCSSRLGGALEVGTIRAIGSPAFKGRVADATQAFFVDGTSRDDDCVLILSNPQFPEMVDQAVTKAQDARSLLGPRLGGIVCTPIITGRWGGQSYAVYHRLEGFSTNKYLRRLQIISSERKIFEWLASVYQHTRSECVPGEEQDRDFLVPLRTLSSDEGLNSRVRECAATLEDELLRGKARALKCLQHGDFWFGNVLFYRGPVGVLSPAHKGFQVIDWAGSRLVGYPGIDALRFATSAFGQGAIASKKVKSFARSIDVRDVEFSLSCFCALGWLASNLNEFPKNRFNELASSIAGFLVGHGFLKND